MDEKRHDAWERRRRVPVKLTVDHDSVRWHREGVVYLATNQRLYDLLQAPGDFIIFSPLEMETPTLILNKRFIVEAHEVEI